MMGELLEEVPYADLKGAYHKLERKNKDLIDGLYYAAFVQQGLLPQSRHFRKLGHSYFVYYNPLQIIGGDFFWIGQKGDWCIYAVGDCTGHGVSGAMLSSLAIGFLNYVVYSKSFEKIGDMLTEIDKKWIETFNHREDTEVNNDWLEISIVAFNRVTRELQFSGAGSSILIGEKQNLKVLKGNAYPIGGWQIETNRRYHTSCSVIPGKLSLYLYSDGFKDQFGSETNRRLGAKSFRDWLCSSMNLSCTKQRAVLEQQFQTWKSDQEQTDDVCLMRIDL